MPRGAGTRLHVQGGRGRQEHPGQDQRRLRAGRPAHDDPRGEGRLAQLCHCGRRTHGRGGGSGPLRLHPGRRRQAVPQAGRPCERQAHQHRRPSAVLLRPEHLGRLSEDVPRERGRGPEGLQGQGDHGHALEDVAQGGREGRRAPLRLHRVVHRHQVQQALGAGEGVHPRDERGQARARLRDPPGEPARPRRGRVVAGERQLGHDLCDWRRRHRPGEADHAGRGRAVPRGRRGRRRLAVRGRDEGALPQEGRGLPATGGVRPVLRGPDERDRAGRRPLRDLQGLRQGRGGQEDRRHAGQRRRHHEDCLQGRRGHRGAAPRGGHRRQRRAGPGGVQGPAPGHRQELAVLSCDRAGRRAAGQVLGQGLRHGSPHRRLRDLRPGQGGRRPLHLLPQGGPRLPRERLGSL
mmetsp:Transcript_29855/g.92765  ORF Transcript_29855/g.92765 Transcript_29855/m.92765 type:complete len:406 (+) Transcript_29855:410-1627(+)